ncbi:putative RNA recognition motif domain, nucleotide-binding alpha-beta plait domain superfamily [Helianthus annuus]|nr:putative RNA recognition motif domain, nucleotide-binding alpha-beta plait domain superfamily [Helianthus annuus]
MGAMNTGNITKFFLSNLPDGCTPWELSCFLKKFGEIAGTYVAKKRDKEGNRFGFASFRNVPDRDKLVADLKGLKMGNFKLKINIARFAAENSGFSGGAGSKTKEADGPKVELPGFDRSKLFAFRDDRTYSGVLGKDKVAGSRQGASGFPEKELVVPDRTVAFSELFGKAVVGRTVDLETLVDLDRLLGIVKTKFEKIQYLGGLSILVSFDDEVAAKGFLEASQVWGPWFSKLALWAGQSLPLERLAWLKLSGVPLHLSEQGVLRSIGEQFGKVLHVPVSLEDDQDLSMTRVGVLSGEVKRIYDCVNLKWKEKRYRVWVEEEQDQWIPDCLRRSASSSVSSSDQFHSSPMASSLVAGVGVGEKSCPGEEEAEGEELDGSMSDKSVGSNPSVVVPEVQPPLSDGDTGSNVVGKGSFFFTSRRNSKRRRFKGRGSHAPKSGNVCVFNSGSSGPPRPNKRSKAQPVDDDPFSLDKFLGLNVVENQVDPGSQNFPRGEDIFNEVNNQEDRGF